MDRRYVCNLKLHQHYVQVFTQVTWFKLPSSFSTDHSTVVPLLQSLLHSKVRGFSGFICEVYFVIVCSFGASRRMRFVIVAFPGYLHIFLPGPSCSKLTMSLGNDSLKL